MPRFKVTGGVLVSAYTLVEAPDEKTAIAIAKDREGSLAPHGWQSDGADPAQEFIVSTADGELFDCKIEPLNDDDKAAWIDHDEGETELNPQEDDDDDVGDDEFFKDPK